LSIRRAVDRSEGLGDGAASQETSRRRDERQNPERLPVHAHSSPENLRKECEKWAEKSSGIETSPHFFRQNRSLKC
jgi:hypothetical protein